MAALFRLLRLLTRAAVRRLLRGAKTPRGAVFLVLGLLVLGLWIGPSLFFSAVGRRSDPEQVRLVAPFILLAFCVATLLTSAGDKAVAFTPAEVDFLFPGPFSRRQLLAYKLAKSAGGAALSSLILSAVLLRHSRYWVACYVGSFLSLLFVQLFSMTVVLIGQIVGRRAYTGGRRALGLVVLGAAAGPLIPLLVKGAQLDSADVMAAVRASPTGAAVLAPFSAFTHALTADTLYPGLAGWGSAALGIDLALAALVFWLDANYLEAAAAASQKLYERLRRVRKGGLSALGAKASAKWRLPQLPWLGGAGPVAWRQLTNALRSARGLLLMVFILAAAIGPVTVAGGKKGKEGELVYLILGMTAWINLFFASMLKFDFRDELDHMDWLKSLPLRPWAVAAAELVAPVLVTTLVQLLVIGVSAGFRPAMAPVLWSAAPFTVPFNVLLFGIENLLFLLFPSRVAGLSAGDLQLFGKQAVIFVLKFLTLLAALGAAALAGGLVFAFMGRSIAAAMAAAWGVLAGLAVAVVPCIALAFARFDPSADTPG